MRFLGIFDKELPDLKELEDGDVCMVKMTSPYCDRYELIRVDEVVKEKSWQNALPWNENHGVVKHYSSGLVEAKTCFSKYNTSRSFTRYSRNLEECIDLVITNYLRHSNYLQADKPELVEYKGTGYFAMRLGDGSYVSGYVRPNGKLYVRDSWGESIVSGAKVKPEEIVSVIKSMRKLKQVA